MEGDTLQDLLEQYRGTRRHCRKMAEKTEGSDREHWGAMARDCEYIIRWLETAKDPDRYKGIENPNAYHREIPVDPQKFPFDHYWGEEDNETRPEDEETIDLFMDDLLSCLSEREREVYEMRHGAMMEYHEIAAVVGMSEGGVYNLLKRAGKKLKDSWG